MTTERLAFDRRSVRHFDKVGRLQVARSAISKANVCGYYGREIPQSDALGLKPDKLYMLYRDPDELRQGAPTFNTIPVLCRHQPDYPGAPAREYRCGTTHASSEFDGTYLVNGLSIWDNAAIAGIETGEQRELSSAYAYVADMTPGKTPDGVRYDGVMRQIVGNHVALVGDGRAGSDVLVFDSLPQELQHMKLNRKGVAMRAALGAYLRPRLAQDASPKDLTRLVGAHQRPNAIANAVKAAFGEHLAQDMEIEPTELAELMEAAEAVVEPEEAAPALDNDNPLDTVLALLSDKVPEAVLEKIRAALMPAADDAPEPPAPEADTVSKPAMDAAIKQATDSATRAAAENFRAVRMAESDVRPLIGEVVAMDSAEEVYRTALAQIGIETDGVHPSAYRSMVKYAVEQKQAIATPRIAMDTAAASSFAADFPSAGKLKRGY